MAASRSLDRELTSARKAPRSFGRASIGITIFESDSRVFVMPNTQSLFNKSLLSRCRCRPRDISCVQSRPIHPVDEYRELRPRQPHHATTHRRPLEGAVLQPLPEKGQSRPIPSKNLHSVRSLGAEYKNCSREGILPKRLPHQRDKTIATFSKINWLRGHQNAHSRRNRNHVAAFTARSTSISRRISMPGTARTTKFLIPISMGIDAATFGASLISVAAVTIGTNTAPSSAGSAKRPSFAAPIQLNRCCELMSCRRAISATATPEFSASATIRPFSCAVQRRRRPTPVRISIRPNATFVSHIVSVICAKPSRQTSEKSAASRAPASRWDRKTAYALSDAGAHPCFPGQRALSSRQARAGMASAAGTTHQAALHPNLLPALEPDRAVMGRDAQACHAQ